MAATASLRFVLMISLVAPGAGRESNPRYEAYWVNRLAKEFKAYKEVKLPDGSRVDLLTDELAIEVDWANKWAEAIGQSLYYGAETDHQAAIILLLRTERDLDYVRRCRKVCVKYHIRLFVKDTRSQPRGEVP